MAAPRGNAWVPPAGAATTCKTVPGLNGRVASSKTGLAALAPTECMACVGCRPGILTTNTMGAGLVL